MDVGLRTDGGTNRPEVQLRHGNIGGLFDACPTTSILDLNIIVGGAIRKTGQIAGDAQANATHRG